MFENNEFRPQSDPRNSDPIETTQFRVHNDPWENGAQPPKPPKRRKGGAAKFVALGLCCALAGGLVGGGSAWYLSQANNGTVLYEGGEHPPVNVDTASVKSGDALTPAQLYAANVDACVGITTETTTTNVFGYPVQGAAAGSGFVISADGYIVTNYHVIKDATAIKVAFQNGQSYDARLVGGEAENDVAVLKIEAAGLHALTLGDSDSLVVGESVYTIGNPLGELTWSLTDGLVSAMDRTVTTSEGQTMNMIQTNTAINSGNSGGPLFNAYGEVVGITSAKLSSSGSSSSASIEGLGFAIPMNDVKGMISDIIAHGYVTGKPNVGILMTDVPEYATQYGVPAGASVEAVLDGSCADKAGLQAGDILCAVDGTEVDSSTTLKDAVREKKAGDTVTFTVYRNGEKQDLQVTLDEDNQDRQNALSDLQEQVSQQKKAAVQQQQGGNYYYNWPFGFGY